MTRFDTTFRDYTAPSGWRLSVACESLDIVTEPFNGDRNPGADGYSYLRTLSINPAPGLWSIPIIAAHELAHIVLGHTEVVATIEDMGLPSAIIPFAQFELEAQMVAKAVGHLLELTEADFMLDHLQHHIAALKSVAPPLGDHDGIRLARATLAIIDAGEAHLGAAAGLLDEEALA